MLLAMRRLWGVTRLFGVLVFAAGLCAARTQTSQNAKDCHAILTMEALGNETNDRVTVCSDGSLFASHTFTAPAFGSTPEKETTWEYRGRAEREELADLKNILTRRDIAELPSQVDVEKDKTRYRLLWTLNATIERDGKQQSVALRNLPTLMGCAMPPEVTGTERDLICLLNQLYAQTKSGSTPEPVCDCRSLHAMVSGE